MTQKEPITITQQPKATRVSGQKCPESDASHLLGWFEVACLPFDIYKGAHL